MLFFIAIFSMFQHVTMILKTIYINKEKIAKTNPKIVGKMM